MLSFLNNIVLLLQLSQTAAVWENELYSLLVLKSLQRGGKHSSYKELCKGLLYTQYLHINRQSW